MRHSAFPQCAQCGMAPLSLNPRAGGPAVLTQLHSPASIVAQNGAAGSDELNAWIGHAAGGQPMSFLLSAGPVVHVAQHSHGSQSLAKACQAAHNQSSPHGKSVRLTARVPRRSVASRLADRAVPVRALRSALGEPHDVQDGPRHMDAQTRMGAQQAHLTDILLSRTLLDYLAPAGCFVRRVVLFWSAICLSCSELTRSCVQAEVVVHIGTDPFTGAQILPNITGIRYARGTSPCCEPTDFP